MDRIKLFLPHEDKCPNISFTMKIISSLICLILGIIMTILAISALCLHPTPHYRIFCLWYTLSNIIWLIFSFILFGPKEYYRKMLSDELYTQSVVLVLFIIISFLFGLLTVSKGMNIFFSLLQFCSIIYFNYSYLTLPPKLEKEKLENPYQNNNLFKELNQ